MYVEGTASTSFGPPTRSRTSATRARALCALNEARPPAASRAASSSMAMAPTLWRLPAYSGPGFPSPTTSQVSMTFLGGVGVRRPCSLGGRAGAGGTGGSGLVALGGGLGGLALGGRSLALGGLLVLLALDAGL